MGSVDKCKICHKGFSGDELGHLLQQLQREHCHRRVNIINNHQFKNQQLYNCS